MRYTLAFDQDQVAALLEGALMLRDDTAEWAQTTGNRSSTSGSLAYRIGRLDILIERLRCALESD